MAEEDKTEEAQGGDQPTGGKSKKKLVIIIVIVTLLAIGLSVGVTVFLLGSDGSEDSEEIEIIEEPVKLPAAYMEINPPFLVTFDVEGRQRYMQVYVSVSSRDPAVFDAIDHHMPLIRSKVISSYSAVKFDEVQSDDGKLALQVKTIEVINGVLEGEGAPLIENVFFTNFVLQ